ncbi:MAG: aldehyde ferredoxin oxidoreductase family protein [Candidatus Lokiarchaeota archaeon]|nr:aldehyde ferredoxin oxidoreductase family protein [Candidatus Lokiarchaeota archaeon]
MSKSKEMPIPDEVKGYSQKRLDVDLTNGKVKESVIPKEYCRDWIGGYGFGAKVLWDELKPGVDPLSPDNVFVYAHGPFPTTILPTSSKYGVFAKSPLTGMFGMAISSGSVGAQARRAGINMIVFKGKAPEPVYLVVDDDDRYLVPCKDSLWGKGTWETEDILREEFQDHRLAVMSIGPAGERMSRLGCITNDRNRQAGRTGMGAVMGSKNLKAVAFRGTKSVNVAQPAEFYKLAKKLIKVANGPATAKYRDLGTPAGLTSYNKLGMMPTHNYREGTWEKIDDGTFTGDTLNADWIVKKVACSQCSIACDHIAHVPKTHPLWPNLYSSIDVEMCYSYGTNTGCSDWPTVFKCVQQCDDLGIDAISGGVTCSMACELYEVGLITKEDLGYELPFGSTANLVKFNEEMILGKGFPGKIFGDGTKEAGKRLEEMGRKNASYYGMQIKGLEMPAFDIHGMTTFAVGESVSIRGACHLRNGAYGVDTKGTYDRFGYEKPVERGKAIKDVEDIYAIVDSYIICKFTRGIYENDDEMAKVYELVTGIPATGDSINKRGEAIVTLSKCFNIREGWTRADDHPPERFFKEPHTKGPAKGFTLDEKGYQSVLSGYYEARGWDKDTGIPTDAKLKELGMDFVIGKLGGKK